MTLDSTRAPISGVPYTTESFRLMIQGLLGGVTGTFAGGLGLDPAHGIVRTTDLAVTQNGTPNMSVNVAAGGCFVRGTESALQGSYPGYNDGTVNVPLAAADGTNPRKDIIGVRVYDSNYGGSDPLDNGMFLEVITGTPAASPADPTLPDNFLPLARMAVSAADTSITTGEITDLRSLARPWNTSWGLLSATAGGTNGRSYVTKTTSITGITTSLADLSGLTMTCDLVPGRLYEAYFEAMGTASGSVTVQGFILVGGTALGCMGPVPFFAAGAGNERRLHGSATFTGSGSTVIKAQAQTFSGTATLNAGTNAPAMLRVRDIGPA